VDVVGGLNLKKQFQEQALAIFVQPPSYDELEKRLRLRSTETEDKISQRMQKAQKELSFAREFDHVIVNDDLEKAIEQARDLVLNFLNER
jgi:guanylate kinase